MTLLEQALAVLREGGLVCVPTESSYGLAVDANNAAAIERLQSLKGRDSVAPFGLIAGTLEQAREYTGTWPAAAVPLAAAHWPGPLTLLLSPGQGTVTTLVGPTGCVGIRVSAREEVAWLASALGAPITATSANPSGKAPATTIAEARAYLGSGVDFYLDGGTCRGQASTLVSFGSDGEAEVLRPGPIILPHHS